MRIAISIDRNAVATVFDFGSKLELIDLDDSGIVNREIVDFDAKLSSLRAAQLKELFIDTVICGAISEPVAIMIQHSGIQLVSGITGGIDSVLQAYCSSTLQDPQYLLPGFAAARGKTTAYDDTRQNSRRKG